MTNRLAAHWPVKPFTKLLFSNVLAGVLFGLPATAYAKNVALLVGVGTYQAPQISKLIGPPNDIEALKGRLTSKLGFLPADIHTLVNSDATKVNILRELESLSDRSAPGDNVLIYYSGHGTSAGQSGNSFDLPYLTGAWLPHDLPFTSITAIKEGLIIGSRDLRPRLKHLDDGGRIVVVLTDSCYSGQLVRSTSAMQAPVRKVDLPSSPTANAVAAPRGIPQPYPYANVLMISAASDSEAAVDLSGPIMNRWPTVDGLPHGAFTDTLLRMLDGQLGRGEQTYLKAFQNIAKHMQTEGYPHEPQFLPSMNEDTKSLATRSFLKPDNSATPLAESKPESLATDAPLKGNSVLLRVDESAKSLKKQYGSLPGVSLVEGAADLALQIKAGEVQITSSAGDLVLGTDKSDVDLTRRIAAEAWLKQLLSQSGQSFSLRLDTNPSTRGGTFVQCERFNFQAQTQRKAYVTLIDLTPRGYVRILYPMVRDILAPLTPGKVFALPGNSPADQIVVTPPFGTDTVIAIATDGEPSFLPRSAKSGAEFDLKSEDGAAMLAGIEKLNGKFEASRTNIRTYPRSGGGKCPD